MAQVQEPPAAPAVQPQPRAGSRLALFMIWCLVILGWAFAGWLLLHPGHLPPAFHPPNRWLTVHEAPTGGVVQVDARLIPALNALRRLDDGHVLLDHIADTDVVLLVGIDGTDDFYAQYRPDPGVIFVGPELQHADPRTLAALLAHELTHARRDLHSDLAADERAMGSEAACAADEHAANLAELGIWQALYGPQWKTEPVLDYERQVNSEQQRYLRAPEQFAAGAARRHAGRCRQGRD